MITFTTITKLGAQNWRYAWTATTAPYRIYHDGRLIDSISVATFDYEASGYTSEPPALEILDANDGGTAENLAYPARAILQWRRVAGVSYYRVQEYVGTTWTLRRRIDEGGLLGYYQFTTPAQADVTEHSWRIIARDGYGNDSSPLAFTFLIVRNPPPPAVTMSYSAVTGEVTVASA